MGAKLIVRMNRAGISLADYPQKGRRPKELDIRELVRESQFAKTKIPLPQVPQTKTQLPETKPLIATAQAKQLPAQKSQEKRAESAKQSGAKFDLASYLSSKVPDYKDWLAKQGLSHHSSRNYLSRVNAFIAILRELDLAYPLLSNDTKNLAVQDLKKHLKRNAKVKPATLNSYLAAVDNFYGFLGLGKTDVVREDLPQEAPQALSPKEQQKFLRAVDLTEEKKIERSPPCFFIQACDFLNVQISSSMICL